MPRKPRVHFPGATFHVISRGNGGQRIFFREDDWSRFLRILAVEKSRSRFQLFAY